MTTAKKNQRPSIPIEDTHKLKHHFLKAAILVVQKKSCGPSTWLRQRGEHMKWIFRFNTLGEGLEKLASWQPCQPITKPRLKFQQ